MPSFNASPEGQTTLVERRKRQAITAIKELKEIVLKELIIIPLFRKRGLRCTSVDRRHEGQHRCDVLMESDAHDDSRIDGAQLKANVDICSKDYVREEIERASAVAVKFDHLLSDGILTTLSKYYWITTGDIDPIGKMGIKEVLGKDSAYFGRVEVWGAERLVDEIQKTAPELLPPLELLRIEQNIRAYRDRGENAFAAHCCSDAFFWHFRQSGPIDLFGASRYLGAVNDCLSTDERKPLFYARTLGAYYKMWEYLISGSADLLPVHGPFNMADLPWDKIEERLKAGYPRCRWWLFRDVYLVLAQLDLLDKIYVKAPAGLSTLRSCQILLRACYPPDREGICDRLQKLYADLEEEGGLSIDGRCSLCTGVAVSVLSLAGQDQRRRSGGAFNWLKSLGNVRYSYNNEAAGRHSLHYAARVLEGLSDFAYPGSAEAEAVADVFFPAHAQNAAALYSEYMRYRNIEEAEVASYIFHGLIREFLTDRQRLDNRRDAIAGVIGNLVDVLERDAGSASRPTAEMYSAQANLGGLVLGAVLGCEPAGYLARQIFRRFHDKLRARSARGSEKERLLWDSSVDRTQSYIEGYLQYWETILCLEEQGEDASPLLLDTEDDCTPV